MALSATTEWDVRTTGSDSNGGGFDTASSGTDYSQQNSAQIAYTDLVIGGTNTQLTSAGNPFTSAHVGNVINVTGGTGFTTGRYQVVSVASNIATMDRAVGTASSTSGAGKLGGGMATIGTANGVAVALNTIHIKSGTYTQTSTIAVPVSTVTWKGYGATHGDGGTKPLITTSTNSTVLINTGSSNAGTQTFQNLSLSNTATTRASGIWQLSAHGTTQWWVFNDCVFDGFTVGIDCSNGTPDDVGFVSINRAEVKNCTSSGYSSTNSGSNSVYVIGSYFHGNAVDLLTGGSTQMTCLVHSIFAGSSGVALNINSNTCLVIGCTVANAASQGLFGTSSAAVLLPINSLFYGNNYGIYLSGTTNAMTACAATAHGNAYKNTGGNNNWSANATDVTLTVNPFTNSGSGDYSLNSTAGGGAACKQAAYPGAFPGGTSTGGLDIGAVQSASGGGGGGSASVMINPGMSGGIRG